MLEHLGDLADNVSLHRYAGNPEGDTADYLAVTAAIDRQIDEMDACAAAEIVTGPEPQAVNSFAEPELIKAQPFRAVAIEDGRARCELPPLSFAALMLRLAPGSAAA